MICSSDGVTYRLSPTYTVATLLKIESCLKMIDYFKYLFIVRCYSINNVLIIQFKGNVLFCSYLRGGLRSIRGIGC